MADFSNSGPLVTFGAPGVAIYSTWKGCLAAAIGAAAIIVAAAAHL